MNINSSKIKKSDLTVSVLLVIGIVVVLNFFAYQIFLRWDLTEGRIYSISDASKKIARELDDIVNIRAYFSEDLPTQYAAVKQQAVDLLREYENFGAAKIKLSFIDPKDDDDVRRQLYMMGIPELTFNVISSDSYQLKNAYLGIAVSHGDKTEVIPAVREENISNLEYQISTAIKKTTMKTIPVIGYLASHGTLDPNADIRTVMGAIEQIYNIENVHLDEEDPVIGRHISTLLVVNPTLEFSEEEFMAINEYLRNGGSIMVAANGVEVGDNLVASKNNSNFFEYLAKYGLIMNKDLVADRRSGQITYSQGFFPIRAQYPFWPQIDRSGFNAEKGPVSNLDNVLLPWAGSIEIDQNRLAPDTYDFLAFTTEQAWRVSDNFNIMPGNNNAQGDIGRFNLAVSINGETTDPYRAEASPMPVRIVAVADADFIRDNFLGGDNPVFFQNLLDYLNIDEDLINIRSKVVSSRPVKETSDQSRQAYKFGNVFGLTVIVLAFGMARHFLRRRSRFADDI